MPRESLVRTPRHPIRSVDLNPHGQMTKPCSSATARHDVFLAWNKFHTTSCRAGARRLLSPFSAAGRGKTADGAALEADGSPRRGIGFPTCASNPRVPQPPTTPRLSTNPPAGRQAYATVPCGSPPPHPTRPQAAGKRRTAPYSQWDGSPRRGIGFPTCASKPRVPQPPTPPRTRRFARTFPVGERFHSPGLPRQRLPGVPDPKRFRKPVEIGRAHV